jgi:hypothetical protein
VVYYLNNQDDIINSSTNLILWDANSGEIDDISYDGNGTFTLHTIGVYNISYNALIDMLGVLTNYGFIYIIWSAYSTQRLAVSGFYPYNASALGISCSGNITISVTDVPATITTYAYSTVSTFIYGMNTTGSTGVYGASITFNPIILYKLWTTWGIFYGNTDAILKKTVDGEHIFYSILDYAIFKPNADVTALFFIIGGGGAGGGGSAGGDGSGSGGGAGGIGYGTVTMSSNTSYIITIGSGGTSTVTGNPGSAGSNSTFVGNDISITAVGGGGGATTGSSLTTGGGSCTDPLSYTGNASLTGVGNTGNTGGLRSATAIYGGGGGGAGSIVLAGSNFTDTVNANQSPNGGFGMIWNDYCYYGGGGGGGNHTNLLPIGSGGSDIGGDGNSASATGANSGYGYAAVANTGSGGGGGTGRVATLGGSGGSGVVIFGFLNK